MDSSGGAEEAFFDAPPSPIPEDSPSPSTSHPSPILLRRGIHSSSKSPSLPSPTNQPSQPPPQNLLQTLSNLVVKTLEYQINILVAFISFPFDWILSGSGRRIADIAPRIFIGVFWGFYVLSALAGCLIFAVMASKIVGGFLVEKPLHLDMNLSFDYTRSCPVAEVAFPQRLVPPGRNLKSAVSLILPESDYNRKLGIFQVKVEFLTADGKRTASSSRPCMLQFKSSVIKNLEVFFKSAFLLTDYSSETQKITLRMDPFKETALQPTSAARVVLSPRAEQRPGTGLPEIYSASMKIESELSPVREMMWRWRRTLFVGLVIFAFNLELLLLLFCCTPLILPGISRRSRNM